MLIIPPKRLRKKSVKRLVERRVAKAIEEYEKTRADSSNANGSGSADTGGIVAPEGRAARIVESNKRKWEDHQRNTNNNNLNNHNNNNNNNNRNRNNNHHQQQNRRQETASAYAAAPTEGRGYSGNLPRCNHCNSHHNGQFPPKCQKCQRTGHQEKDCRARLLGRNQQNEGAHGRAYVVVENPQQNLNVVTCTFLLNDHYACTLFDSGAEKSFISSMFTPFIDIAPAVLNTSYKLELADGKV
nr:hypothetical protein [Tanacetum cinerariifolium]